MLCFGLVRSVYSAGSMGGSAGSFLTDTTWMGSDELSERHLA